MLEVHIEQQSSARIAKGNAQKVGFQGAFQGSTQAKGMGGKS